MSKSPEYDFFCSLCVADRKCDNVSYNIVSSMAGTVLTVLPEDFTKATGTPPATS